MSSFTQRQATPKKGGEYRGSVVRKFESSEDDDSSDSGDSDEEQSWKRHKTSAAPRFSHRMPPQGFNRGRDMAGSGFIDRKDRKPMDSCRGGGAEAKRRKNNIWGSVVAEQTQEQVEKEITTFGMDKQVGRDVESYSYSETVALGTVAGLPSGRDTVKQRELLKGVGEGEDDAWLADESPRQSDEEEEGPKAHDDLRERLKQRGSMVADQFRRAHVKNRLGARSDSAEEITPMRTVEIDPKGDAKVVAGQLAYGLQEPKRDLLLRIVKTLGVKKALGIWKETEDIENDGGMMIRNQSRRRSPGGVFIQLMKTDPDISKEDIKTIFEEEKKLFEAERKKRRRHTRKLAGSSMDVDRRGDGNMEEGMGDPDNGQEIVGAGEEDSEMDMKDGIHTKQDNYFMSVERDEIKLEDSQFPFAKQETAKKDKVELPLPQQECVDIKEESDSFLFAQHVIKTEDIPKRNEDSEPEDGEVIDDDD